MALVQTLVGLAPLEAEVGSLRARQLALISLALNNWQQGLDDAVDGGVLSPAPGGVSLSGDVINTNTPDCYELQPDQDIGSGLESVQWLGIKYPNCALVLGELDENRGIVRRLRVEMGVELNQKGSLSSQIKPDALRVHRSCWVSLATQAKPCS